MIHPTAHIGTLVELGEHVHVGPHASIEGVVMVGAGCRIAAGARIGGDGFGYTLQPNGTWEPKHHGFGVVLEEDVHVGANAVICRGSYRDTVVGRGTRVDGGVFVAHNVVIGADCLVIANAEVSGSVVVGDGAIIGPRAAVKEHLAIGVRALIGIGSVVICDVPGGEVWAGSPARFLRARRDGEAV